MEETMLNIAFTGQPCLHFAEHQISAASLTSGKTTYDELSLTALAWPQPPCNHNLDHCRHVTLKTNQN